MTCVATPDAIAIGLFCFFLGVSMAEFRKTQHYKCLAGCLAMRFLVELEHLWTPWLFYHILVPSSAITNQHNPGEYNTTAAIDKKYSSFYSKL